MGYFKEVMKELKPTARKSTCTNKLSALIDHITSSTSLLLNNNNTNAVDDTDDWLQVEPHALDKMLQERNKDDTSSLDRIANDVHNFVEKVSDFEGAEFPDYNHDAEGVQLDPTKFTRAVKVALGEHSCGDESEDSDSEDKSGEMDPSMVHVMDVLDAELQTTALKSEEDIDVDVTLVKNLLASFAEQHGLSGPTSTLLAELQEL